MPTRYSPDTCNCIIIYDDKCESLVNWEQKCQLHKDLDSKELLNGVFTYNQSIGVVEESSTLSEEQQIDYIVTEKQKALEANTALGPPIENPEL